MLHMQVYTIYKMLNDFMLNDSIRTCSKYFFFPYSDISLTEKWESGKEEVLRGKLLRKNFYFRMIHDCLTFIIDGENSLFDRGIKKNLREMRKIIH